MSLWLQSQCPVVKLEIKKNKLTLISKSLPFRVPITDLWFNIRNEKTESQQHPVYHKRQTYLKNTVLILLLFLLLLL